MNKNSRSYHSNNKFMKTKQKPKNFKKTLKKFITYLKPYKFRIILAIFFSILSCTFTVLGPKLLSLATTEIFEGYIRLNNNTGTINFKYIFNIILILIFLYIISACFILFQNFTMTTISQKISYLFRNEIYEKINKLPLEYFDNKTTGETLSKITNVVDNLTQSLHQVLSQSITSITTVILVILIMLTISPIMTLVAFFTIPASLIVTGLIVKLTQKYYKKQIKSLNTANGQIEEAFSGQNIIKAFNNEDEFINKFNDINNELYNSSWKSQFLSNLIWPLTIFIGNLGYVLISILGGILSAKKLIQVGDILAFIQYMKSLNQPLNQMSQVANIIQSTIASAENIFEFLEEKEEVFSKNTDINTKNILGNVEFKNVNFGYNKDKLVINNFSIKIDSGKKVAIVGPTGAGKTTIMKILMRFYELNSGEILIDNINIKQFSKHKLRKIFGIVLQDTWLFNGTIKENIKFGNSFSSDDEIIKASKAVHAHDFIINLPDGYNTILNEDSNNISQGQKQLITIARAFLSNPKILILDEATSSIDTRTEILIQKALKELTNNRTSFIIAHRLSTIKDADIILVINNGDIIEQGNHTDLLKKKGFYYDLYNSQFEIN